MARVRRRKRYVHHPKKGAGGGCIDPGPDLSTAGACVKNRIRNVRVGSIATKLTVSTSGPLYPSKPDLDVALEHFAVGPGPDIQCYRGLAKRVRRQRSTICSTSSVPRRVGGPSTTVALTLAISALSAASRRRTVASS